MKGLLVHVCCAHCAAYTVAYWRGQGYEVGGLWYNPNIHPYTEHQSRLDTVKALACEMGFPLVVAAGYDMVAYFRRVAGQENERCRHCFRLRLAKTVEVACEKGFGAFTTTLLISPHQEHELIHKVGDELSGEAGVEFLYADLRKCYSESRRFTKPLELYRQQYCGCLYSEWERYADLTAGQIEHGKPRE